MSYNPFNFFRRNQKSFFAVLTIFVMFMFVLSFGQGDFFQSLPRWLGSRRGSGEVMAVVDGSKVYQSQLEGRRGGRVLANQFMARASDVAANNTFQYVNSTTGTTTATTKQAIEGATLVHRMLTGQERQFNQQLLGAYLPMVQGQLAEIVSKPGQPKDDLDAARAAQQMLLLDLMNQVAQTNGYFATQPNRSLNDHLEFDLWLRKADKLGITYSAEDAKDLVTREFYGRFGDADYKSVEADFQKANRQGYTKAKLEAALAEEFKVRAAQAVVLGPMHARTPDPGLQAFSSPYESYQFFRDQCAGATYGVIGVPVENYVSQVTAQPTDGELREIFQKYRNQEPNPSLERPGLKEPRKLKVQWLEVRGDEPFFKAAATDTLKKADVQAKLAGFLVAPVSAAGWGYLAAPAPFALGDPALARAYDDYKQRFKTELDVNLFPTFFGTHRAVTPSLVKPATIAAAAGAAAGSVLTHGSPFSVGLVFEQRAAVEERNARARVGAAFLANPAVPGAGLAVPVGAAVVALARLPQPLPLAAVRSELLEKTYADLARKLAETDLEKFQTELTKLGAKKDKAEAKAYLETFAKERGLKVGGSTAFYDMYSMDKDAGLAPLREKMEKLNAFSSAPFRFGLEFFLEQDARTQQVKPTSSFYAPQSYPPAGRVIPGFNMPITLREGESNYLTWRTDEQPAESPKDFEAARLKALAAWKEIKARDLAKAAAEQLAKDAEKLGNQPGQVDQGLRDLHTKYVNAFADPAAKERAVYTIIPNVCPLPPNPTFGSNFQAGGAQYEPFTLRPTKEIPFPTQQMLDDLLKNKDKPLSTALVLPDAGKDVFYVAVVKQHATLDVSDFAGKVYTPDAMSTQLANNVNQRHQSEELRDARKQAVDLLKVEFKVEKESPKLTEKSESLGE